MFPLKNLARKELRLIHVSKRGPTQRTHYAKMTSLLRQNDVIVTLLRHNDVVLT